MIKLLLLFLLSVVGIFTEPIDHSILNIEELNSIHYSINIGNSPVLKQQEWKSETVTVTNKHGQEYICELPKIEFSENENKKDEDVLDQLVNVSELLKPMEAAPCLIKRKDWWTYEFCYGSLIKQYHLEDNRVTGTILVLGKFESEYNWKNSSETKNKLQKFHSQFYVNGTRCDITGEPRRTEVRFHCEEGTGDYILQVDEPESCRYIVTIATTRVCHHPYLRSSFSKSPHSITCAPALNEHQLEKYQKLDALKQKLKEEKLELSSDSEQNEEDEAKWSIRLLSLPISKIDKFTGDEIESKQPEPQKSDSDRIDETQQSTNSKTTDSAENDQDVQEETEPKDVDDEFEFNMNFDNHKLIEDEIEKSFKNVLDALYKNDKKSNAENQNNENFDHRLQSIRDKINNLFDKWRELRDVQSEDRASELIRYIQNTLDDSVVKLQHGSFKIPGNFFSDYFDEVSSMIDGSLEKLNGMETVDNLLILSDITALSKSIMKATRNMITKSISETSKVMKEIRKITNHQKDLANLEKDEDVVFSKSVPSSTDEDPIDEIEESHKPDEYLDDKTVTDTRQVRILNERILEESHKSKLEQSIKDRLQKSDNFGRKIEVKILTPNYLDDEEKDSLALMTDEETEAFHNVIVNILSAGAEEINERERQNSLESNYNFQIDDIITEADNLTEEEASSSDDADTAADSATRNQ